MIKQQKAEAIGQRAAFGLSCFELRKKGGRLHVFGADTQTSAGLKRFIQSYPMTSQIVLLVSLQW